MCVFFHQISVWFIIFERFCRVVSRGIAPDACVRCGVMNRYEDALYMIFCFAGSHDIVEIDGDGITLFSNLISCTILYVHKMTCMEPEYVPDRM